MMDESEEQPNVQIHMLFPKRGHTQWRQWLASICATLSMVAVGTVYGWTTTMLTRLEKNKDVPLQITSDEGSWIVSIAVITSMVGSFLGACLADLFGRKKCLLSSSIFFIVGWLIVIFADTVVWLYISRVVLGVGVGMSYTTNPMYVSEVADTNIRGALGTLIAVNVFTGSLITCSVGPFVSYRTLGVVLLSIAIVFVASFVFFPESPYYLAMKNREREAIRAIMYFKGCNTEEARQELTIIVRNIDDDRVNSEGSRKKIRRLLSYNNRKAFAMVLGLIITQQLSGNFTTMQYLSKFFDAANIGIDADYATIIVFTVGLVSGTVSTMTVEKAGRRTLLILSAFFCSATLIILSVYLLLNSKKIDLTAVNLLPVILVILFVVAYQVGIGTLPNALIGELFPTSAKSVAGAAITISDGVLGFVVSKLYQIIGDAFGEHYVYFFFGGSCFVAFVFILYYIPETKNKSFGEIQEELASTCSKFSVNKYLRSSRKEQGDDRVV
ncbi:facilitated trehalose transporter Tret1 isoform X2 [Fopius arisanus]|uniref:Facilitated trehalose transporter Tret1 isoform X2 n=1 Tax=Fopius arisanus TaxID=64838 RepID=A0A0C9RL92_9HYME|nr:PREDICTED: facilitated trehalose transporter Tret1-like isoform X2 [Fopius arisanus]